MLVVGRDYFIIDIRYACLAMCYNCFVGSESKINQGRLPNAGLPDYQDSKAAEGKSG